MDLLKHMFTQPTDAELSPAELAARKARRAAIQAQILKLQAEADRRAARKQRKQKL